VGASLTSEATLQLRIVMAGLAAWGVISDAEFLNRALHAAGDLLRQGEPELAATTPSHAWIAEPARST